MEILEAEFEKEQNWAKDKMKFLARLLGLRVSQIYKWNWDRRQALDPYIIRLGYDVFSVVKQPIFDEQGREILFKVTKVDRTKEKKQPFMIGA